MLTAEVSGVVVVGGHAGEGFTHKFLMDKDESRAVDEHESHSLRRPASEPASQ